MSFYVHACMHIQVHLWIHMGDVRDDTHLVGWETGQPHLCWPCHWVCTHSALGTLWVPFTGHAGQGEWKGLSWWYTSWACCLWYWRSRRRLASRWQCSGLQQWKGEYSCFGFCRLGGLRDDLGFVVGRAGLLALRAGGVVKYWVWRDLCSMCH